MQLEYNPEKRNQTLLERGLDFEDIKFAEWDSARTVEDNRKFYGETRFVTTAKINNRLCVFAWCWRGEVMRIISLRKANEREIKLYENSLHQ